MAPKNSIELNREDLIALIEERAEDVCGGKMYEVEVRIDELEEDLEASKEVIKTLKQSLSQAKSDLQSLNEENKHLKTLVTTLKENKDLRTNNEVMQLKKEIDVVKKDKLTKTQVSEIKKLQQEVEELTIIKEDIKKSNKQEDFSAIHEDIRRLKQSRDGINKELLKKERQITMLKMEVDRMDQKQRETSLRISGVPEDDNEDLKKAMTKMAKNKLGLKKFNEDNIEVVYRSGKKRQQRNRDIILQFKSKTTKDLFQQSRKKLTEGIAPANKIYLNDDLTEFRKKLLYDARQLAKREKLKAAWSQEGNIMVLKNTQEKPLAISTHEDLRKAVEPLEAWQSDDEESSLSLSIY